MLGPSKLLCTNYWTNTNPAVSTYSTNVSNHTGKEPGDDNEFIVDHFEAWLHADDRIAKPWLGVLWLHTVHVPHPAMPKWFNSVPYPAHNGDYQGTIAQMDSQIGRLRAMLQELGLANDTALFYTSDNGPHAQSLDTGVSVGGFLPTGEYFNGLRQCKGSIFEGGVRVPGILEWPAMIRSHRETWLPMGVYDYLPTVLDILGLHRPAEFASWELDGISLLPWIAASTAEGMPVRRGKPIGLIQHDGADGESSSQARIDEEMKLVFNPGAGQCSWIDANYSSSSAASQWFLFNLSSDPRETHDLKADLPQLFSQLKASHQAWVQSVQLSRSTETLCEPTGPPRPPAPAPPAPPAPPVAGAFVLSPEAGPSLCVTAQSSTRKFSVALVPCVNGSADQAWKIAPVDGTEGDLGIASVSASNKGGSFLKVNEKIAPAGHACDAGNALTLGRPTSGKVNTFFTAWSTAPNPPSGLGSARCAGCSGMCVGVSNNETALAACTASTAKLLARPTEGGDVGVAREPMQPRLKSDEAQAAKPRPHILFVMAGECKASVVSRRALCSESNELCLTDDLGHGDVGHFNGGKTHTPAIDALIADGVTLSSYCNLVMLSRFVAPLSR